MENKIITINSVGVDARGYSHPVVIEVQVMDGVGIHLVGLADNAARESLLRVVTALQALGYSLPGKKVVVNIAPANIHKTTCGYDLPIALGILAATDQLDYDDRLKRWVFNAELGLDGSLREAIPAQGGALAKATLELLAWHRPYTLVVSTETALGAATQTDALPYGFDHLKQVIDILKHPEEDMSGYLIWNRPEWGLFLKWIETIDEICK